MRWGTGCTVVDDGILVDAPRGAVSSDVGPSLSIVRLKISLAGESALIVRDTLGSDLLENWRWAFEEGWECS